MLKLEQSKRRHRREEERHDLLRIYFKKYILAGK